MTEARGSSRRRLAFTTPPVSQPTATACSLCNQVHTNLSSPISWRDECCRELALTLGITEQSLVCRPCRNDITRLMKDPYHIPRWEKERVRECAVSKCKNNFFSKCNIPMSDIVHCLELAGEGIPSQLDTAPPLCKHHYHMVYNAHKPTQTHCPTCGTGLQINSRPCPDPTTIRLYLAEKTGYEGTLSENDRVCFACYKSHLHIMKHTQNLSTDSDLNELIMETKRTMIRLEDVKTADDAISRAMSVTTLHVGEAIMNQEGLLLPDIHNFFLEKLNDAPLPTLTKEQSITARWVLSNLTTALKHHLSYVCKIRKCGTLLYRSNGDIFLALTNALYASTRQAVSACSESGGRNTAHCDSDNTQTVLNSISSAMHNQIQVFLKADDKYPYRFDQLEISSLVSQINPTLWRAICIITQSVSERQGKGRVNEATHVKTVRRFFCLCALMFCTNDRCSMPLHNLITDLVDGLGGSALLVKMLNRLGVCSSADTLARSIQYQVTERENRGVQSECSSTAFTIISIDNIDFLHSYARVFCGDQKRSWHGTTIQLVQPQPKYLHELPQSPQSDNHTINSNDGVYRQLQNSHIHRRRKRDVDRPYASPSSKSPVPKIQRRARTAMEAYKLTGSTKEHEVLQLRDPSMCIVHNPMDSISVTDFMPSACEDASVNQLAEDMYTYLWLKHSLKPYNPGEAFVGLQDYLKLTKPREDEQSCIIYFDVLDAVADKKETVLLVLDKLKKQIVDAHQREWLVVAGDAKLYDTLKSIKFEYGDEFTWLICYPGDWHMLANFQKALMKPYFDAGLKELAKTAGYPTAAIQACSQFKRTHAFIMDAWEAIFQVMLHSYLDGADHDPIAEAVKQQLLSDSTPHDLDIIISTLHMSQTTEYKHFQGFLEQKSSKSENWKFWSQFVLRDGLAYVGMYLAIRSGNWNLRVACMKLMAPLFCAFDHMTYKRLICNHIADLLTLPRVIQNCFSEGGFVVSNKGRPWHSVAVDEAHEMRINKSCKTSIVHPTEDYIHRIANYIPYRNKCLENLREQLFPEENKHPQKIPSLFTIVAQTNKKETNVEAITKCISSGKLLSEAQELNNPYTNKTATPQQREDLVNFYLMGEREFVKYIEYKVLHRPSTKAPNRKHKLLTFSECKPTKTQVNQLQKDKKLVTKCLHRRLKWHQQTGQPLQNLAEQYIPYPLAISDNKGYPLKGQKSNSTKFLEQRYKNSDKPVIINNIPLGWSPQCVIIEGMFIINTSPLGTHRTYGEYALFLFRRFIMVHFNRGCREVHAIFDNPERLKLPKNFERDRRDKSASVAIHTCDIIEATVPIPAKWRESVINCRQCKRSLTVFLSKYWLEKASRHLQSGMVLYIAGALDAEKSDTASFVSVDQPKPQPILDYKSNAEETDTRIWLHVHKSTQQRFYIMSPDTDVYHIALPLHFGNKEILIEINVTGSTQKRILSVSNLKSNLASDPDLSGISPTLLPQVVQTLYTATGCDYTSFFSGLGKITLMKSFFQHAEFISGTNSMGSLADITLEPDNHETGFLSFLRLIGTAYFKKYASAFSGSTPQAHFNVFQTQNRQASVKLQHFKWLENIRNSIWDRTEFENNMIPSTDALYRHWLRSCWVIDMWRQANNPEIILKPVDLYGWKIEDGKLEFDWDSDATIQRVQTRVQGLLKGCKCTKGCKTNACGCKRRGQSCTEGCQCQECGNLPYSFTQTSIHSDREEREQTTRDYEDGDSYSDASIDEQHQALDAEVGEIMRSVFGNDSDEECD